MFCRYPIWVDSAYVYYLEREKSIHFRKDGAACTTIFIFCLYGKYWLDVIKSGLYLQMLKVFGIQSPFAI